VLDLAYEEDFKAEVDMNVVMTGSGEFHRGPGTAEGRPFGRDMLDRLLATALEGHRGAYEDTEGNADKVC